VKRRKVTVVGVQASESQRNCPENTERRRHHCGCEQLAGMLPAVMELHRPYRFIGDGLNDRASATPLR